MTPARTRGYPPTPPIERVKRRSTYEDRGHESLCLIYKGALNDGYGVLFLGSRTDGSRRCIAAHKAVYEHFNGPVPEGLELDHLCHQRDCCEVTHLEAVTHSENIRRTWPLRRARKALRAASVPEQEVPANATSHRPPRDQPVRRSP